MKPHEQEHQIAVRRWVLTLPGPIFAATYDECMRLAHEASGLECDRATFQRLLKDGGYEPECRNDRDSGGYFWCLSLPSPQRDGARSASAPPWAR